MATGEFPGVCGTPFTDLRMHISSGKRLMHFGKREEEDILCLLQPSGLNQLSTDGLEEATHLSEQEREDESGHLTVACQGMGTLEAKASEPPAQPVVLYSTMGKGRNHLVSRTCSALELDIRRLCRISHLMTIWMTIWLVAGKTCQHIVWVFRPARYTEVEFGDPQMAVLMQKAGEALLQRRRQTLCEIVMCKLSSRSMLDEVRCCWISTDLFGE